METTTQHQVEDRSHPERVDDGTERASQRLSCLLEVARVVNSSLDLTAVLEHLLTHARYELRAESGSIMLLDEPSRQLRVLAAQGPRAKQIVGRSRDMGEGIAGWVALHGEPLLLSGAASERRFTRVPRRRDVRVALCAPLSTETEMLGVISLNNRLDDGVFTPDDLDLLTAIAHQAALAIRNARSFEEMCRQRRTVERVLDELTRAQEEERKRIALLLHDGPAQTLFAALRNLEVARAAQGRAELGELALTELEHTIRQAIQETRALMIDLRPPCLDEMGLPAALRHYARQFQQRSGIAAEVTHRGANRRLPSVVESSFYRITQEALTNVWKHAAAKHAEVVLEVGAGSCSLSISDDGTGFDREAAAAEAEHHLGMVSLRDRAELVGGCLAITSLPGRGTTINVTVPLTD